jgi:hypothetical protein
MMIRRIFAGSIVTLLLAVSTLSAACDLSCAFDSMNSDCHSGQTESQQSAPGDMKMDGMVMAGMTMPKMASSEHKLTLAPISRTKASHPSIGEMGPCERQSCDNGSADSAKTNRSADSHFYSILAITETSSADIAPPLIRDARDDVGTYHVRDRSLLHLALRI